jgi:acyl carrier protein
MLRDTVIDIVADQTRIPRESVSLDSTFEELGIDSLTGVVIVSSLEEELDITIPDEIAREIRSIRETIEKLEQQLQRVRG